MICIAENSGGQGGVAGGGGSAGQGSGVASGAGANGYGWPVIEVVTGMTTDLSVQLTKDYSGEVASDLSDIKHVIFMCRPSMCTYNRDIRVECSFTPEGVVTIPLTPKELNYNNGVWYAEFLCYADDELKVMPQNYRAYLCIRKGMDGSTNGPNTITVMDVRLAVMDTSPEANTLLDDLEFSDMMILHAVERAINEFNETPPSLAQVFDLRTFPFKEHLIKGAVGYLMQEVAYRYTRNRMQYSAAGLTLDTSDKGPMYIQLAQHARMEWKNFVAQKKTEMNMHECFGTFDLPYFGNKWYRGW